MRKQVARLAGVCVGILGLAQAAQAEMIGFDFSGVGSTPVTGNDTAGVVPQSSWNNLPSSTGTLSAGQVLDDGGNVVSGLSATWGATGSVTAGQWSYSTSFANAGDNHLFSQAQMVYASSPGQAWYGTFSVSGITANSYDIYVYAAGAVASAAVSLNGTANPVSFTRMSSISSYAAADGNPSTAADYVLFPGVSGASFTIDSWVSSGSNGGLVGIQIVAAPEPGSLGILMLSSVGLLIGRGRRV